MHLVYDKRTCFINELSCLKRNFNINISPIIAIFHFLNFYTILSWCSMYFKCLRTYYIIHVTVACSVYRDKDNFSCKCAKCWNYKCEMWTLTNLFGVFKCFCSCICFDKCCNVLVSTTISCFFSCLQMWKTQNKFPLSF